MGRRALIVAASTASLAACTLLVDTYGFTSGGDGGALPDASEDASDGGPDVLADVADVVDARTPLGCDAAAEGLVAYFRMDEGVGTLVRDCSGNALLGSLPMPGGGWGDGIRDAALGLDAAMISLGRPPAFSRTGAITIAAWVKAEVLAADERPGIVSKMGTGNSRGWELGVQSASENNTAVFRISPDGGTEFEAVGASLVPGTWTHLAGVFEPGVELRIYANGVREATTPTALTVMHDPPVDAVLGGRAYAYFYRGLLDEVRVYDRALTDEDIAAIAAAR